MLADNDNKTKKQLLINGKLSPLNKSATKNINDKSRSSNKKSKMDFEYVKDSIIEDENDIDDY